MPRQTNAQRRAVAAARIQRAQRTHALRRRYGNRRRVVRGKFARRKFNRMSYNKEVKSVEQSTSTNHKLEYLVGDATKGPNNSLVLLPGLFEKTTLATQVYLKNGLNDQEVIGRWVRPAYGYNQKFTIDWKTMKSNNGIMPSPNITCIAGFIKNTGDKIDADITTMGSWTTDIRALVLKELVDSGFDSHHCSYTSRNRNLKILSKYVVKPRDAPHKVGWSGAEHADSDNTFSPNTNLTINYPVPKFKTKLEATGDDYLVLNNLWIPFCLFVADSFTTLDEGYISIQTASKFYFTDT